MVSLLTVLALALAMLTVTGVEPASAHVGEEGCTPGYWKNHLDNWPSAHDPDDAVEGAYWFLGSATWLANYDQGGVYASFAGDTLEDTLNYGGGPGLDGATRILLRASTAALLNTAALGANGDPEVAFITVNQPLIISWVKAALETGDRAEILALASTLDAANNGPDGCPL